jgi:hypothetical protein
MTFQVGDRVVAESESTQRAPRTGTVLEVPPGATRRRGSGSKWDDGHTTIYTPAAGALHAARKPAGTTS